MVVDVVLRPMERQDLAAVTALCIQLGYPTNEEAVTHRFTALSGEEDHQLLVASAGDAVVGWVHVHLWQGLESGPDGEIGGLVVDEGRRGAGVGRLLMQEAERWTRARGCTRLRLRSNVVRTGAHAFYQRLGYRIAKTQYAFEKVLAA